MAVAALWTPCNAACTVRALRVHCACTVRTHAPPHERVLRPGVCAHVCVSPFARACLTLKLSATLPSSQRHSPTKWMLQGLLRRFAMLVHNWTCPGVGPRRVSHQGPPSGVSQCSSTTGLVQAWVRGASRTCILTSPERWMLKGHPAFRNARPQLDLSRHGPAARLAPASDKPRKVDAKGPQLDLSRRGPAARLAHAPSSTEQQPVQRPSPLRRHGSALRERLGAHHCPQRWPGHKACHPSTPCSSDASRSTALSSPCLPLASILLSVLGAFQIWYSGMDFNSTLFKFAKRLPMDQRVSNS